MASVDASRLEFVLPYAAHRSKQRPAESAAVAIDDISADRLQEVVSATVDASPQYESTAVSYRQIQTDSRQRSVAQLILRDTLKVTGSETMTPPVAGIFFVHEPDPDRGGTGHTMRVCRARGVPVIQQSQWLEWPFLR